MKRRIFNKLLLTSPLFLNASWRTNNAMKMDQKPKALPMSFLANSFRLFQSRNIILPTPIGKEERFLIVPLKFVLTADNKIKGIDYDEGIVKPNRVLHTEVNYQFTKQKAFLDEAVRLVELFPNWGDYNPDREQVEFKFQIYFTYHAAYFEEEDIVLNPSIRASFQEEGAQYQYTIEGSRGCDGIADLLFLVETDGSISHVAFLGASGKTNQAFAERGLGRLGNLIPAQENGKAVRSQLNLLIHT